MMNRVREIVREELAGCVPLVHIEERTARSSRLPTHQTRLLRLARRAHFPRLARPGHRRRYDP